MISFEDSYELNQGFIRGKGLESEISENVPNGPMKIVFRGALYQTIVDLSQRDVRLSAQHLMKNRYLLRKCSDEYGTGLLKGKEN
ncbi:hypothetical protein B9Z55_025423 [Caenorhabditis nigoni]|uniref:Uncharacterized protein n=1 Tax=Caenorhabditis nigoni TaxID=1611254 RepID=A0A2G5SZ46_9PELO|nr:hypothetical protein B9Z55_025423 [Caenorhabditis nigoni]